ncbi:hypothetical protein JZ785_02155 [Alicyclobacillus curvatus]|nr:hypothetical protein JZ785_02155 [Alicyclobacillus curvatus]
MTASSTTKDCGVRQHKLTSTGWRTWLHQLVPYYQTITSNTNPEGAWLVLLFRFGSTALSC